MSNGVIQCFLLQAFFETLIVPSVPGCLFPFLHLLEAFLLDCALDFSCIHTHFKASRDIKKQTHVQGSHTFLVKVEVVLPLE
jgi:hypothetical protein